MTESTPTQLASVFAERWRQRDPALRLAEVYAAGPGWVVGMSLYFELAECLFRISEPSVREAKLGWWMEEVGCYAQGQARHPLSQALQAHSISAQRLRALVTGMAAMLDGAAAESRSQLQQQRKPMLESLGQLLLELDGQCVDLALVPESLTQLNWLDDCYRVYSLGLQRVQPLPLLSLAEHAQIGLSRAQVAELSVEQLRDLRRHLTADWRLAGAQPSPALAAYLSLWLPALRRLGAQPKVGAWAAIRAWRAARRARNAQT